MKYYIDEDNINYILSEVFFESPQGIPSIIDIYKDKYSKIKDFPEDVLLNKTYEDTAYHVDIKNAEEFKEEMITRLDCMWLDQVENRLKEVLRDYNDSFI